MQKLCSKCGQVGEFSKNASRAGGYQTHCKSCRRKGSQRYYQDNKAAQVKRVRAGRKELARKVFEFLSSEKCIDCPESDPIVLEFDHVKGKKGRSISAMVQGGFSWENILKEIEKCVVRCANCHRRKTMRERKQARWVFSLATVAKR